MPTQLDLEKIAAKPKVIEHIFNKRYNVTSKKIDDMIVTSDDIIEAIKHCNEKGGKQLSTKNPANFLKDYLRSPKRNEIWPESLKNARITARQKYRNKRVFAFYPYGDNQDEPFPDLFQLPENVEEHVVESVSLPSAARALGRAGEAWLIQVCVNQRIVQTHFSIHSKLSSEAHDFFHLQNSVKSTPEIDATFLITLKKGDLKKKAIITLEAKRNEPILPDQIRAQVALMAHQCSKKKELSDITLIIPIAVRSQVHDGNRSIGLFEMAPISVDEGKKAYSKEEEHLLNLEIQTVVAYRLRPSVIGV